ncbi:MAG: 30S ribosomal protein S6 [Candidatus Eremiobacteraeota bacterium]|nr:30S ribosomal protein S6 [Candidatus Eremiobacteraeota bacterium]MBC5828353.1 30S ribosomal protein S6 [Candidatus Eremiobacteraeota bacterium]
MSLYEITYILRPALEDPNVDELATHFSDVAKDGGGQSLNVERMGKKRLAYDIQKTREGHYVCMRFDGNSDCAKEVIRQMRLHENVLRALLVKP